MGKTKDIIKKAEEQVGTYAELVNYDDVNDMLTRTDIELKAVSKKTLQNIGKWALNGADESEIANNLEINVQQFRTLCKICPMIVSIMNHSRQLANVVIAGSLFDTAIGGRKVHKLVLVKVTDYNEQGYKCGEHYEEKEIWEELPPNPMLLKFLAEKKLDEKLGEKVEKDDKQYDKIVENMSAEQIKAVTDELMK